MHPCFLDPQPSLQSRRIEPRTLRARAKQVGFWSPAHRRHVWKVHRLMRSLFQVLEETWVLLIHFFMKIKYTSSLASEMVCSFGIWGYLPRISMGSKPRRGPTAVNFLGSPFKIDKTQGDGGFAHKKLPLRFCPTRRYRSPGWGSLL